MNGLLNLGDVVVDREMELLCDMLSFILMLFLSESNMDKLENICYCGRLIWLEIIIERTNTNRCFACLLFNLFRLGLLGRVLDNDCCFFRFGLAGIEFIDTMHRFFLDLLDDIRKLVEEFYFFSLDWYLFTILFRFGCYLFIKPKVHHGLFQCWLSMNSGLFFGWRRNKLLECRYSIL